MSDLKEKMLMDMQLRGFSPKTQTAYLAYVKRFEEYFGKSTILLDENHIREFLHQAISRGLSSSYINSCYSGLRFMFETTMGREWNIKHIPRTKKEHKLPVILSSGEVISLFNVTHNLKHKAMLMTTFGAGLRVSETANLRIEDIDSKNMQIHIRQGKGKKDRYSLLSQKNLEIIREYWKIDRPRQWLFPGIRVDQPITTRSIQRVFSEARSKAGIKKAVSIHSLRHTFATRLLEQGVPLPYIQQLLGHTNLNTTQIYFHVMRMDVLKIKSPLDAMEDFKND